MNPLDPCGLVSLEGFAVMRGVTVAWPCDVVERFLPAGLSLGPQSLTPRGTHPVILLFYDVFDAHLTIPSALPPLTYHEHIVGVPFTYTDCGARDCDGHGPLFYMPRLKLDSRLAVMGAVMFWGFDKEMARVQSLDQHYVVRDLTGAPLISLEYERVGRPLPIDRFPRFDALRRALDQPVVSRLPLARGRCIGACTFERAWRDAELRPLRTVVRIDRPFVPGMPRGRFPDAGFAAGIDASDLGSFELATYWRLGLPTTVDQLT